MNIKASNGLFFVFRTVEGMEQVVNRRSFVELNADRFQGSELFFERHLLLSVERICVGRVTHCHEQRCNREDRVLYAISMG